MAGTASAYATYNLTVYSTDQAGNQNSSTKQFTTSPTVAGTPGGGGVTEVEYVEVLVEAKGVCGNGICEPEYGESFWNCPQDCGGISLDSLILSCFSESEEERQKCITNQAPVVFWIAIVLIFMTAIAMVTKIPGVKKYQARIMKVQTKPKKKTSASSWLKRNQNWVKKWRK